MFLLFLASTLGGLAGADGAGLAGTPGSVRTRGEASKIIPARWRSTAEAWTKTDDESTAKRWGLEIAIIKRGLDVVGQRLNTEWPKSPRSLCWFPSTPALGAASLWWRQSAGHGDSW